jgi:hypothetical protein
VTEARDEGTFRLEERHSARVDVVCWTVVSSERSIVDREGGEAREL